MESSVRGLLAASVLLMVSPISASEPLSEYRWKHRLIVASVTSNPEAKVVRQLLDRSRPEVRDRDLVVIDVSESRLIDGAIRLSAVDTAAVRRQLSMPANGGQFVLIGKDGGVKARQNGKLALGKFFALIDTMPMRRAEMRRKRD